MSGKSQPNVRQLFSVLMSMMKKKSIVGGTFSIVLVNSGAQCFRFKFTSKSSDLRTKYLPGGQTDAEVFVKRNIDISSVYATILYLFQFQNKNGQFPVCLPVTAPA